MIVDIYFYFSFLVDKYWSVGEAAVIYSEHFSGWFRAIVLEVSSAWLLYYYIGLARI